MFDTISAQFFLDSTDLLESKVLYFVKKAFNSSIDSKLSIFDIFK